MFDEQAKEMLKGMIELSKVNAPGIAEATRIQLEAFIANGFSREEAIQLIIAGNKK